MRCKVKSVYSIIVFHCGEVVSLSVTFLCYKFIFVEVDVIGIIVVVIVPLLDFLCCDSVNSQSFGYIGKRLFLCAEIFPFIIPFYAGINQEAEFEETSFLIIGGINLSTFFFHDEVDLHTLEMLFKDVSEVRCPPSLFCLDAEDTITKLARLNESSEIISLGFLSQFKDNISLPFLGSVVFHHRSFSVQKPID